MKRDRFVPDAAPDPVVDADMAQALRLSLVAVMLSMAALAVSEVMVRRARRRVFDDEARR